MSDDRTVGSLSGAGRPSDAVARAALNALTVKLACEEAREERVLVDAVGPGCPASFRGGAQLGARPMPEGAATAIWAALLDDDGPRGRPLRDGAPLP